MIGVWESEFETPLTYVAESILKKDDTISVRQVWRSKTTGNITSVDTKAGADYSEAGQEAAYKHYRWKEWLDSRKDEIKKWQDQSAKHAAVQKLKSLPADTPADIKKQEAIKAYKSKRKEQQVHDKETHSERKTFIKYAAVIGGIAVVGLLAVKYGWFK